ncbi:MULTISPECIES: HIT family protein [Cysteiniphilum]|uniref:HIT family protein n=1 Tax=Cysteiniphilum TaxID=2056696 RepID=UPI001781B1E5|nr:MULTISPECIES: HIT family protein [Cysteiniphilum]
MTAFVLDKALADSSSLIKDLGDIQLRLSNNALVTWFLIVPKVTVTEWFELDIDMQLRLNALINTLSRFLKEDLRVDKVNVATIGNVVSQMHIHVIGRKKDDFCWPDVVWGNSKSQAYVPHQKDSLISSLLKLV